ncbi:family 16 glycosylhydrolase [Parabacteroides sp. PF5-9]|uniref:family 16 glycosylhydrolase n=1 Tax=Parabacteroides sp. PF5-9 TaxID=1742404 RepID=UPI0024762471|nr:family 16 glycosylhydrolase [Parabacteroides sp. PF5-9]MDH6357383.1 beta-glucanase (GH16 family) [Parabacteroides sp. PF5-9]
MKKNVLISVGLLISLSAFSQGFFRLDWHDEFDGKELDQKKWSVQLGTGESEGLTDWGNNEQQYYTNENYVVKDGMLIITAKKEQRGNKLYTSSRLLTRDKYQTTYGRIEARIRVNAVEGVWPAFWMMPQESFYGQWAASGEIDIFEGKGRLPYQYSGAIHYGGSWPRNTYSGTGELHIPNGGRLDDFHLYAIEWSPDKMSWYCDDVPLAEVKGWYSENGTTGAPFDRDFYILLNLAIGGNFDEGRMPPGDFISAEMRVDYVRVYKWDDYLSEKETVDHNVSVISPEITISQSEHEIVIHSPYTIRTASLYTMSGKLTTQTDRTNILNTSTLDRGHYILYVQDTNGSNTFKVVIM